MDRSAAVGRIQQQLGFRSDLSTEIVTALQDAQSEAERDPVLPWFLRNDDLTSFSTAADTETVALPTGFIRESEGDDLHWYDANAADADKWTELAKHDLTYLRKNLPGEGEPQAYHLGLTNLFIFPTPDAVYTLRMVYYKADTTLSTDVENQWLLHAHDYLIGKAGRKIAGPLRDALALAEFEKLEASGKLRMFADSEAREQASTRLIMGGAD
tara:strand:+ start:69 stop:707 length:639 start_codon:yes stop_codon:yes gene_type:complete